MRGVGGGVGGPPLRDHLWQGPPLPVTLRFIHPPPKMTQGVTNPPSSPFNSILARGRKSVRIASLFSLFSFAIFLRLDLTNFSRFRRTLSTGFDCWLCYFRYLRRFHRYALAASPEPFGSMTTFIRLTVSGPWRMTLALVGGMTVTHSASIR